LWLTSACFLLRYQKLQKGETGGNASGDSDATKVPAKYVILEEAEDQEEGI